MLPIPHQLTKCTSSRASILVFDVREYLSVVQLHHTNEHGLPLLRPRHAIECSHRGCQSAWEAPLSSIPAATDARYMLGSPRAARI